MKSDFPIDNKPELRNCPFCGNKAYLIGLFVPYDDDEINEYQVGCEECGNECSTDGDGIDCNWAFVEYFEKELRERGYYESRA